MKFDNPLELTSNTKCQRNLLNGMEDEDIRAQCMMNVICFIAF